MDVAYLTDTPQDCTASAPGSFNVEGESQNVQTKFYCKPQDDTDANSRNQAYAAFDEEGCTEANGAWTGAYCFFARFFCTFFFARFCARGCVCV